MFLALFLITSILPASAATCNLPAASATEILPVLRAAARSLSGPTVIWASPDPQFEDMMSSISLEPLRRGTLTIVTTHHEATLPPGSTVIRVVAITDRIRVSPTGEVTGMGECEELIGQVETAFLAIFDPE